MSSFDNGYGVPTCAIQKCTGSSIDAHVHVGAR
jgi:hypothetical protein